MRDGKLNFHGETVVRRSPGRKAKAEAGALLNEAQMLLGSTATRESFTQPVDRDAAQAMHCRAREFQNEFKNQQWAPVRFLHCWPLLLVEQGLALYLGEENSPSACYKLAANFCQHYDFRYGNSLCGPSPTKVMEIVRFMFAVESIKEEHEY